MIVVSLRILGPAIWITALQGIGLGIFAVLANAHELNIRILLVAFISSVVKGFIFPWLLKKAVVEAGIQKETQPFIGPSVSAIIAILFFCLSLWIGSKLDITHEFSLQLVIPASFMTIFCGLFLIIARRKALTQVIGFIILENGIYTFGIASVGEIPALVELGMLLDAFVAVLVMGIAIYKIQREFDHIDVAQLDNLKG